MRIKLTDILRRYCNERRFGMWLADSRIGYRTGNWFQICIHDMKGQVSDFGDQTGTSDPTIIEACVPVTLIGPARIGSTHAIMSFLGQYNDVGILSSAITTLDDVALIHFQISARGIKRSQVADLSSRLDEHGTLLQTGGRAETAP